MLFSYLFQLVPFLGSMFLLHVASSSVNPLEEENSNGQGEFKRGLTDTSSHILFSWIDRLRVQTVPIYLRNREFN